MLTQASDLLNAYNAPLEALTSPGNFYFLEFPLNGASNDDNRSPEGYSTLSPKCGDGSRYSFVFRRGSDEHLSKLVVEFEGGPACWNGGDGSCCGGANGLRQTPWYDYLQNDELSIVSGGYFPPLNSCTGISAGFTKEAASALFGRDAKDVPISVRGSRNGTMDEWKDFLASDIDDWSYILLPHCTLDWHLGHQPSPQFTGCGNEKVYHRGGTNVQAVMDWVNTQFPSGLDALITSAGGSLGGCNSERPEHASSIAPMFFAEGIVADHYVSLAKTASMLVLVEGSGLWNDRLPSHDEMMDRWNARELVTTGRLLDTVEAVVENSPDAIQYAWFASKDGFGHGNKEAEYLAALKRAKPDSFHVYVPVAVDTGKPPESCPRFSLPDTMHNEDLVLESFFRNVAHKMSWSSRVADTNRKNKTVGSSNLTFFSIAVLLVSLFVLSWVSYYVLRHHRYKQNKPPPPTPYDLWLTALTQYPRTFFAISLLIPVLLSSLAFTRSQVTVNLDFDRYLNISTEVEDIARSYSALQKYQSASLELEEQNCALLSGYGSFNRKMRSVESDETYSSFGGTEDQVSGPLAHDNLNSQPSDRNLYNLYRSTGQGIIIMYQNRNGGDVFTPEVLDSIRHFEQSILDFPGFSDFCFGIGGNCLQFDSIIPSFYPNGQLVEDIDSVVSSFTSNPSALWKLDQYFGADNLSSNITRSFVWLKDVGGDQSAAHEFLESLYRDLFWSTDQSKPLTYPDITFTWSNGYLESVEAKDALNHDALWSAGSLIFIGIMIFLKVRNGFVFLSSMLGLVLAFVTAYYWVSVHFDIEQITLLHVSSLFVMLGIGADDIFLMVDAFEHTKLEYCAEEADVEYCAENDDEDIQTSSFYNKPDIIRARMKSAYSTAGSMMLVSSTTAAVCFFSNAFGVLVVIQEFGIYMGMVVLVNYVHVMTILPSAIMVNELYILPWWYRRNNHFYAKNKNAGELQEGKRRTDDIKKCNSAMMDTQKTELFESTSIIPETPEDMGFHESTRRLSASSRQSYQGRAAQTSKPESGQRDTSTMNSMDRWLVERYSPFLSSRYRAILFVSVALSIMLGALGITNFAMSDGAIVLFSEKYNLGRLQALNDAYFSEDISKTVESIDAINAAPGSSGGSGSSASGNSSAGSGSNSNGGQQVGPASTATPPVTMPAPTMAPQVPPSPSPTVTPRADDGDAAAPTNPPGAESPVEGPQSGVSNSAPVGVQTQTPVIPSPTRAPVASPPTGGGEAGSGGTPAGSGSGGSRPSPAANDAPRCEQPCQNGGTCTFQGTCYCADGWDGPLCTIPVCPRNINGELCSGLGVCIDHPNGINGSTMCSCPVEFAGSADCGTKVELSRRQAIVVRLIWGVQPKEDASNLWLIKDNDPQQTVAAAGYGGRNLMVGRRNSHRGSSDSQFDLSEPRVQEWLLKVVQMARKDETLNVQPDRLTWIEIFRDFVVNRGLEFPIRKDLFVGYLELLKNLNPDFAGLIRNEIGTKSPGLAGDFLFTSITIHADVPASETAISTTALNAWNRFVQDVNKESPKHNVPPVVVQSRSFNDAYRAEQTVDSTLATWFVANGLCFLIILAFSQNLLLCFMIMVAITLIFLCLAGLLFAVFRLPFGPVEALGVSIFIGLSANYSLHVVHAYHSSPKTSRQEKMEDAVFGVGSPIAASALSTIGGSVFLFGCRTWVFVELGILICSITTLALFFSMGFLLSWLKASGPVPISLQSGEEEEDQGAVVDPTMATDPDHASGHHLHHWDIAALFQAARCKKLLAPISSAWTTAATATNHQAVIVADDEGHSSEFEDGFPSSEGTNKRKTRHKKENQPCKERSASEKSSSSQRMIA